MCTPIPDPGFATAEAAVAVSDALAETENAGVLSEEEDISSVPGEVCKAEGFEADRDKPVPHPDYHHNGVQTDARYKGGSAVIEVTNPTVNHGGGPEEFVVSRVLGKAYAGSDWVEAGWAEVS